MAESKRPSKGDTPKPVQEFAFMEKRADVISPDLKWIKKSRDDVPATDTNQPKPENPLLTLTPHPPKNNPNSPKPAQDGGDGE